MMFSEDTQVTGIVFNIQHYSVHDGPGIRSNISPKGCHLACRLLSHPESQSPMPELASNKGPCIGLDNCTRCLWSCPHQAIRPGSDGKPVIDRTLCRDCAFQRAAACPPHAAIVYGEHRTVDSVLQEVEKQ